MNHLIYFLPLFLPGEYIDINFDQKKPQKEPSPKSARSEHVGTWQKPSGGGTFSAPIMREHDYEEVGGDDEHYAMMSPTDSTDSAPKLSSSLLKVTCPLSLDDPTMDVLPVETAQSPASVSELVTSLSLDSNTRTPSGGVQSPRQQTTVVSPYGHSSPISPAATSGGDDSDYFNLDLSGGMGKKSTSPSKVGSGGVTTPKTKVTTKVDQSSAGGGSSSRKHSSSPLASLLHGLSQGRKSPKHRGGSSPKHSVSDDPASAYSEMSFLPLSVSPKVNRRKSDSSSPSSSSTSLNPNAPSQFTKTPPHSIVTVKPSAVHTTATGAVHVHNTAIGVHTTATGAPQTQTHRSVLAQDSNGRNNTSNEKNFAAMRSIKSTGSLSAMDVVSSTPSSKRIDESSSKILLTSTELINELSAGNTANSGTTRLSQDMSSAAYENMSFENNKPLRQTSRTSVGSGGVEPELHYAALDLSASAEDIMPLMGFDHPGLQKSPGNKSRHTSGVGPNSTNGSGGVGGGVIDEGAPLQYAQIDFVKSESLKANLTSGNSISTSGNTTVKETQMPFDVANMVLPLQAVQTPHTTNDTTTVKKTQPPFDLA